MTALDYALEWIKGELIEGRLSSDSGSFHWLVAGSCGSWRPLRQCMRWSCPRSSPGH